MGHCGADRQQFAGKMPPEFRLPIGWRMESMVVAWGQVDYALIQISVLQKKKQQMRLEFCASDGNIQNPYLFLIHSYALCVLPGHVRGPVRRTQKRFQTIGHSFHLFYIFNPKPININKFNINSPFKLPAPPVRWSPSQSTGFYRPPVTPNSCWHQWVGRSPSRIAQKIPPNSDRTWTNADIECVSVCERFTFAEHIY